MSHSGRPQKSHGLSVVAVVVAVVAIVVGVSVTSGTTSAAPDNDSLSTADLEAIKTAVEVEDPSDLYEYLGNPVHVQFAASDFDADRTPDNAVTDLNYIAGSSGWNWQVAPEQLDAFRAGMYGDSFTEGSIVGESAEGYVLSFTVSGRDVTDIFVSRSVGLITAPPSTPTP